MIDLPLRCRCGSLIGVARGICSSRVNRVVCYCHGCQDYAHALGRYDEIVDEQGGTDVFQMSPRDLNFFSGVEHLACMQITEKGALRWYAQCCQTPIAHTLASLRFPFMAVNQVCIDWSRVDCSQEIIIGPVRARVNFQFRQTARQTAHHTTLPAEAKQLATTRIAQTIALVKMLIHFLPIFALWLLRGDAKRSPFLDPQSGKLIAIPKIRKTIGE